MTEQETQEELLTRFELVEMMVKEGRRSTEYWGWTFVLWGAAYLIAIGWTYWSHRPDIAWSVTMTAAVVITIVVATRKKEPRRRPRSPAPLAAYGPRSVVPYLFSALPRPSADTRKYTSTSPR